MGRNLLKKIVKYSMCLVLEKWKYRQLNGAGRKKLFFKKAFWLPAVVNRSERSKQAYHYYTCEVFLIGSAPGNCQRVWDKWWWPRADGAFHRQLLLGTLQQRDGMYSASILSTFLEICCSIFVSLAHFVTSTIFWFFLRTQHVSHTVDVSGFGVCFEMTAECLLFIFHP